MFMNSAPQITMVGDKNMNKNYYAHSLEGHPIEEWQSLEDHLENVKRLAGLFAEDFGGEIWGHLLGINHDLGKATLFWQAYLRYVNGISDGFSKHYAGRVEHSAVGAKKLYEDSKEAGKLMAYCVAGHHGGLPNWVDSQNSSLKEKLKRNLPEIAIKISRHRVPTSLPFSVKNPVRFGFQLQFFVRMLFSCLVDADFLDTEATLDKEKGSRRSQYPDLHQLYPLFWKEFDQLRKQAEKTKVNGQRERVLADCLEMANEETGIFSLTVPTGGGKSLASLAFALEHGKKHQKQRIIYVIPFTSIIEQTASVFRQMLGNDAVLEHHCNFIPDDADWKSRLATENWDAPIVVTTNVQFFDSLFSRKPSKCRKLHNIVNSVVIFDEVQAIPVEKLMPCLEAIRELTKNYKVTSILCTATQPALHYRDEFQSGLRNVKEIVQDVSSLFNTLKRTTEEYIGTLTEDDLAAALLEYEQVLCILNTRQEALDVFGRLPESEENIHLSALMHPAHRSTKLMEVRRRLEKGLPCRVISTQLIEAGVDVDFSCVFRAISGIDSIAQAAGRCNRNGLAKSPCSVFVFRFPESSECSFFRGAAQSAEKLFDRFNGNLTSPECVTQYFLDYLWKNQHRMDESGTLELCRNACKGDIQFKDIANFRMIETATLPVVIALETVAVRLVQQLPFAKHTGSILRRLQQYSVQVYPYQLNEIHSWLEEPVPGVKVLYSEELYSDQTGLKCREPEGCAFFG